MAWDDTKEDYNGSNEAASEIIAADWNDMVTDQKTRLTVASLQSSDIDHDATTNYDANEHFTEASINHANIQNIGSNTHAQIDSHIANTSNPHSVGKADVGLGNVPNTDIAYSTTIGVDGLDDVAITTPVDNELLAYNSGTGEWVNQTASEAGLATSADLSSHTGDSTIHFTQAAISIPASQISDFDTEVSNNTDVANATSHLASTSNPHGVTAAQASAVALTGNETVNGVKTFSSFPVTPSAAPTADYQVANKKYVDDEITAAGGYNDEAAQDAVGGILTDSSEIDFTYNDATPSITASLVAGAIDETKLDTSVNASLDLADSAVQPGDNVSTLTNDSGFIVSTDVTYENLNTNGDVGTSASTLAAGDDSRFLSSVQKTDLTDSGDSTLHYHSADRNRSNHTGTQTASTISDFDTEVSNNTDVVANTSARHDAVTLAGEDFLSLTGQQITANAINLDNLSATGTASSNTFLRGDNTWATPSGSGDVSKVGTPVDNQVGVWTGDGTIEGTSSLTYDGIALDVTGNITVSGTVDGRDIATDGTKLDGIESGAEVNNISDANATDLTDSGDSTLHYHSNDRDRANHTGTQTASTISDFTSSVQAISINNVSEDATPQLGGELDAQNNNIINVDEVVASGARFGGASNLRSFNVYGTDIDGRLSIQGGSDSDNPGVEMTVDGNDSRVLCRLNRVGTDGTELQIFTEPDGGNIANYWTFGSDGNFNFNNSTRITGLANPTDAQDAATKASSEAVVTTARVNAAGALMDSEVTSLSGVKTLTVPDNTTISTFGASLVDDTDAATARATLGAGTMSNLSDDTTPQLGGNLDLNSKGFTEELTAAESLSAGDLCYMNGSGEMAKADADSEATCDTLLAISLDSPSASATGTFLLFGRYTTSGLTAGANYYASTTAGAITSTAPSGTGDIVRIIGTAISTTVLFFNPDRTFVEVA